MTEKVIIVNQGGFGEVSAEKGSYNKLIELITEALEEEQEIRPGTKQKLAEVRVVKTSAEAEEKAAAGDADVLVFVTRGMLLEARKIKATYRRLKVVVLTGLLPVEKEVILVNKDWLDSYQSIREHIL